MSLVHHLRSSQPSIGRVSSTPQSPLQLVPVSDENLITRYSLVCHTTKTKVVVGANGCSKSEMLSAFGLESAREALCAFFMHNRAHPMVLIAENPAEERSFPLYREFTDRLDEEVVE